MISVLTPHDLFLLTMVGPKKTPGGLYRYLLKIGTSHANAHCLCLPIELSKPGAKLCSLGSTDE